MKKTTKILISTLFASLLVIFYTLSLNSYPSGYTGVTKKTATNGCYCHSNNTAITGVVTGPDTVAAGSTVNYTITITRSGYSGSHGGVDISSRLGSLNPGPGAADLKLLSGEITQKHALTFSSGTVSIQFSYTAPSTAGIDTIWSNVVAGYSNGFNWSPEKRVIVTGGTTGIGTEHQATGMSFTLNQNFPNPFNPSTTISFDLPKTGAVTLVIYDINGKKVDELINGEMSRGSHYVNWNASDVSSGVYYYVLRSNDVELTKTMILTK